MHNSTSNKTDKRGEHKITSETRTSVKLVEPFGVCGPWGSESMQNRWVRVRRKREANDTLRFVALTSAVGGVVNRGRHNWKYKTHVLSGTDPLHSQPYLLLTSNTSNWKRQLICLFLFSTSHLCLFTPLGSVLCMNRSVMYVYTTGSRFNTYPFVRFRIWHRFLVLPIWNLIIYVHFEDAKQMW